MCVKHPVGSLRAPSITVVRSSAVKSGKIGIMSDGGLGHLPVFAGYAGPGLLDAVTNGDVLASPFADEMAAAMRAADNGAGALRLYGNYRGDVMNFDI